jgi:hypothetical protein
MGHHEGHRIVEERREGHFKLLRCSCGARTLLTGGSALRLDRSHWDSLTRLVSSAGLLAPVERTSAPQEGILAGLGVFRPAEAPQGGCN